MNEKIRDELIKIAHEAGVGAIEVSEEKATYKSSDGTTSLNPGYFVEKDSEGNSHYFTIEDDLLENNIDLTNLVVNIKKLNTLNVIKVCVVFFAVLTAIALVVGLIYGIQLGNAINALKEVF